MTGATSRPQLVFLVQALITPRRTGDGTGQEAEMSAKDLKDLLERVEDTHELVLRHTGIALRAGASDALFAAWSAARAEANLAYDAWVARPSRAMYAVYRAAEDRADAAEDALAAANAVD